MAMHSARQIYGDYEPTGTSLEDLFKSFYGPGANLSGSVVYLYRKHICPHEISELPHHQDIQASGIPFSPSGDSRVFNCDLSMSS